MKALTKLQNMTFERSYLAIWSMFYILKSEYDQKMPISQTNPWHHKEEAFENKHIH